MAQAHLLNNDTAKSIIDLSPDRIPEFINQSRADRRLCEMIVVLNKQFNDGSPREIEQAEQALKRLGFVLD